MMNIMAYELYLNFLIKYNSNFSSLVVRCTSLMSNDYHVRQHRYRPFQSSRKVLLNGTTLE